jgi:hypothetical protein
MAQQRCVERRGRRAAKVRSREAGEELKDGPRSHALQCAVLGLLSLAALGELVVELGELALGTG